MFELKDRVEYEGSIWTVRGRTIEDKPRFDLINEAGIWQINVPGTKLRLADGGAR